MKNNNIVAIMYDFDKNLCTKDMQEYTFIPKLGMEASEFWEEVNKIRNKNGMDGVLAYMYLMLKKANELNTPIKESDLEKMGKDIELYPGVTNWFKRINDYGKSLGLKVEHYIISSGLNEIIQGSEISKYFEKIYASEFLYENGHAVWPKSAINYTNKTQFIYRINKGILDICDDDNLNRKMSEEDRRISKNNMIYIGDGLTDVPSMITIKDNGGVSIAVYTDKSKNLAKSLLDEERIDYIAEANYNDNSDIDKIIKRVLKMMSLKISLKEDNLTIKNS
jgi:hypothetical protein